MSQQFFGVVLAFVMAALPVSAQTVVSTSSSVQSGFAVITPTSSNGAGLTAFETIANVQGTGIVQTTIIPATSLRTNAAVVVNLDTVPNPAPSQNGGTPGTAGISISGGHGTTLMGQGQDLGNGGTQANGIRDVTPTSQLTSTGAVPGPLFNNTAIVITNPNPIPVTLGVALITGQGSAVTLPAVTVASMQQLSGFVNQFLSSSTSIPLPVNGVINFTSDLPVAITGVEFRGNAFDTLPVASTVTGSGTTLNPQLVLGIPQVALGVGGTGALLLPQFVIGGGDWASQITIQNLSTVPQTVRVDLFNSNGTPLASTVNGLTGSTFQDLVVPPGGTLNLNAQ